jgi:hypothetical protein
MGHKVNNCPVRREEYKRKHKRQHGTRGSIKNDVWEIVPRPKSKDVVSSKWLFKIKHVADGSIEKYKARFVAHGGFSQQEGIDYEETFAPVARYTSIRDHYSSCCQDEMEAALDGREDNFPEWCY